MKTIYIKCRRCGQILGAKQVEEDDKRNYIYITCDSCERNQQIEHERYDARMEGY